jgi:hypothetical protein
MPRRVVELLACWKRRFNRKDLNVILNVIPSCLMWYVWREMNARSFNDCEKTSSDSFVSLNPSMSGSLLTPFLMSLTL